MLYLYLCCLQIKEYLKYINKYIFVLTFISIFVLSTIFSLYRIDAINSKYLYSLDIILSLLNLCKINFVSSCQHSEKYLAFIIVINILSDSFEAILYTFCNIKNKKLITIVKTIKQRNSLKQIIDYVANVFKYYYYNLMQQHINCLKKLFKLKLNQIINCLDDLNKTKIQKKVTRNSNQITKANQIDISILRQFIDNITNN